MTTKDAPPVMGADARRAGSSERRGCDDTTIRPHGHVTSLSQIAADVLQIPIENIDVIQGDTRQVQAGHGTFNSRSMAVGGSSVHDLHFASQK